MFSCNIKRINIFVIQFCFVYGKLEKCYNFFTDFSTNGNFPFIFNLSCLAVFWLKIIFIMSIKSDLIWVILTFKLKLSLSYFLCLCLCVTAPTANCLCYTKFIVFISKWNTLLIFYLAFVQQKPNKNFLPIFLYVNYYCCVFHSLVFVFVYNQNVNFSKT